MQLEDMVMVIYCSYYNNEVTDASNSVITWWSMFVGKTHLEYDASCINMFIFMFKIVTS